MSAHCAFCQWLLGFIDTALSLAHAHALFSDNVAPSNICQNLCLWSIVVACCSFAGVGLAKGPVSKLVDKVHQSRNARDRWRRAKVLIIDEVSMIDGELFDKLEYIARATRMDSRPFGGIQVILSGASSRWRLRVEVAC